MEPLDPQLAIKLTKLSHQYEIDEMIKNGEIKNPPEFSSFEEKLASYVRNSRKFNTVKKVDNADYGLTVEILKLIEDACCCTLKDLRNNKRDHGLSVARALFVFLERHLNKRSTPEIGALINKDHTSILHLKRRQPEYRETKIFEVYMKNARLKELYNKARFGV